MSTKVVPGQLVAVSEASLVAREASARIARVLRDAIGRKGSAAMALSGGNSPRDTYARLAREEGIAWQKLHIFWVDERAVPPTDDRSNYKWARATLLDAANVVPEKVHRMLGDGPDLATAAREYERTIRDHVEVDGDGIPAFDAVVLGVGDDGHTASLFPGEATVDVADRLVDAVPAASGREARLTITSLAIEHARNVFVLATGSGKHVALERVWAAQGDVHETPARIIRECRGAVTWIIDKAAGGMAE